jgi:L,D-peptidoglycan transpeptidase YkuD (ErfK/YbiS/YcfS/YnhG family)
MARPATQLRRGFCAVLLPALLLVLGLAAPSRASTLDGGAGARVAAVSRVILDGVSVALPAAGSQVVTVNHTRGHRARVSLWQRDTSGWRLLARAGAGRIGYGGLVPARQRKQATGTTPLGTFRLMSSFGTHAREAGFDLDHRTIRVGDYWVQDNRSAYYNRYRNKAEGGFRWWLPQSDPNSSERLTDFTVQYEYALVTSFNYAAQVRHRGSGIFLHVNGSGATAGCVSAPRWFLRQTLAALDPAQQPVIAIGR